jgi:hypothetical protein
MKSVPILIRLKESSNNLILMKLLILRNTVEMSVKDSDHFTLFEYELLCSRSDSAGFVFNDSTSMKLFCPLKSLSNHNRFDA